MGGVTSKTSRIDFAGGTQMTFRFSEQPRVDQLRTLVEQAGFPEAQIQRFGRAEGNQVLIKLPAHRPALPRFAAPSHSLTLTSSPFLLLTMQFRSLALAALAMASTAVAQLKIKNPNSQNWWVAKSTNVLEWSCNEANVPQQFTVLVSNQNPAILVSPLAIIAIQQNYQCSILVTQDQANQAPGTGYEILLANPLNNTDVYARSEPFEIKPLGSLYPTQQAAAISSSSAAAAAAAATGKADGTTSNNKNGAATIGANLLAGAVGVIGGALALL
jgi:hypothetical protein